MKALWIVNICCGALHQKLYGKKSMNGQWLDAMLEEAASHKDDHVVVVNVGENPQQTPYRCENVTYYTLPGERSPNYDYTSSKSIYTWKQIFEKEKPDALVIWGTEFPFALAAMQAFPDVPSVVYVQGILDSIAKYYLSGLTARELKQAITFRDVLKRETIRQTQRQFEKRSRYEQEIICRAKHIIVENQWAEAYYQKTLSSVQVHKLPLSISQSFHNHVWTEENMQPYTIMCPAANYPIKGLHMLLKALAIVKETYPAVRLYIPGTVLKNPTSLKSKLKQNGYDRLIRRMLAELGLEKHVFYTGRLTADEMAQKMAEVNCFVMCSAIENHSSTLKEAMTVGTPCVASYVGGVPEYATHGENCLLYRFEDYEVLAQHICRMFAQKEERAHLSQTASQQMRQAKPESDYEGMLRILEKVTEGKR